MTLTKTQKLIKRFGALSIWGKARKSVGKRLREKGVNGFNRWQHASVLSMQAFEEYYRSL